MFRSGIRFLLKTRIKNIIPVYPSHLSPWPYPEQFGDPARWQIRGKLLKTFNLGKGTRFKSFRTKN